MDLRGQVGTLGRSLHRFPTRLSCFPFQARLSLPKLSLTTLLLLFCESAALNSFRNIWYSKNVVYFVKSATLADLSRAYIHL